MIGVERARIHVQRQQAPRYRAASRGLSQPLPCVALELSPSGKVAALKGDALVEVMNGSGARLVKDNRSPSLDLDGTNRLRVLHEAFSLGEEVNGAESPGRALIDRQTEPHARAVVGEHADDVDALWYAAGYDPSSVSMSLTICSVEWAQIDEGPNSMSEVNPVQFVLMAATNLWTSNTPTMFME
jgi:hypothetical protein